MAEEGTVIEGEGVESHSNPSVVEQKARAKGWKDRDESQLPEEDWVDAKEFIGRQKLFDQIHDFKRQIGSLNKKHYSEMQQVSEYLSKMQDVEFEKAMRQLKAEKKLALEDNNAVAADQINEEIKQTEKDFEAAKKVVPKATAATEAENQEFNDWRQENKWFEEDKTLQVEALALGTGFRHQNPNSTQSEVLEYVENRIHKLYPEKFEKQEKITMKQNVVESGSGNPGTRTKKGLTRGDLNDNEIRVMETLIKGNVLKEKADKNKITQEQQYLNDIAEVKKLR